MWFAEGDAVDRFFFLPLRGMKVLPVLPSLKLTGSLPLKIGLLPQQETIVFQPSIFRCFGAVSFRGAIFAVFWKDVNMSSPGQFFAFL